MKISIITVCFNSVETIGRTIDSVISQSYQSIEYIIIDGKSTDGTHDLVESYRIKFLKSGFDYKVISEADAGIFDAMNKGIEIATGDWLVFLNSDDYFCDGMVLDQVSKFFSTNADILYGKIAYLKNGNFVKYSKLHNLNKLRYYCSIPHPATFVRAKILKNNRFDLSYKFAADYDLFYRLYRKGIKFEMVPITTTYFSLDGVTSNFRFKTRCEDLRIKIRNKDYFYAIYSLYNLLKGLMGDIYNKLLTK